MKSLKDHLYSTWAMARVCREIIPPFLVDSFDRKSMACVSHLDLIWSLSAPKQNACQLLELCWTIYSYLTFEYFHPPRKHFVRLCASIKTGRLSVPSFP